MRREILLHERFDLLGADLRRAAAAAATTTNNNVSARQFVATTARIGHADDGGVEDARVREEQGLELGWRDLQALVLDKFFLPIDDVELPVLAHAHVAGLEPGAVAREGVARRGRVVPVSRRDDRALQDELALGAVGHVVLVVVDDAQPHVRQQGRDAAGVVLLGPRHRRHGPRRLAQPPRLADLAPELLLRLRLQFRSHGRGARHGVHKCLELVRHERRLRDEQVDRRDGEEVRDAELSVVLEEFRERELRHPVYGAPSQGRVHEVALAAGDVGGREVRQRAVFEGPVWVGQAPGGEVFADLVLWDQTFGDEVLVRDVDA